MAEADYEVRASRRRTRTMTAFREGGRIVVVVPARMSAADRNKHVPPLVARLLEREAKAPRGDAALTARAAALHARYLEPLVGPAPEFGVRWVSNQRTRWGSCTAATGEIRLSDRLRSMPEWVVDSVLVHELAHLHVASHNADFRRLENTFPDKARAEAFLAGVQHARAYGVG